MRLKAITLLRAWLFLGELVAWCLVLIRVLRGQARQAGPWVGVALSADMVGRVWSHQSPIPMPYFMHALLLLPRGPLSPRRFTQVLQPRRGERMLEIGPGIGVYALPIAALLLPDGILDVLDVQRPMLDDLARRAAREGLTNILPTQGDAQALPYPAHTFDAAYLVGVLGEIPEGHLALREVRRVLKPGGRLLISELLIDPDFVSLAALHRQARAAGFVVERWVGPGVAYSALLRSFAAR